MVYLMKLLIKIMKMKTKRRVKKAVNTIPVMRVMLIVTFTRWSVTMNWMMEMNLKRMEMKEYFLKTFIR